MRALQHILSPTDLTPLADSAFGHAAALAVANDATLTALYWRPDDASESAAQWNAEGLFEETVALNVRPADVPLLKWVGAVVGGAGPAEAIARAAAERHIDLIVMGSRRRPLRATLLGSTSEAVCRIAPCPVLVTHPDSQNESDGSVRYRRILVGYDFWDDSEIALQHAIRLAADHGAELLLVHVIPQPDAFAPELAWNDLSSHNQIHRLEARLASAVPQAAALGVRVVTRVVAGHPYRELLALAEEHSVDLICMGAKGRDSGARSLFGSNSDRVLRQAVCPVLVARPLRPLTDTNDNPALTLQEPGIGS